MRRPRIRVTHPLAVVVLIGAAGLVACSSPPPIRLTEYSTTTSATTAEFTLPSAPPLVAGVIGWWDGFEVTTVCVTVEQEYPQVPEYRFDETGLLTRLLAPSGVTVVAPGQPCAAQLDVRMHLEGRSAEYRDFGTVYTGMYRTFDAVLATEGMTPLPYHTETDLPAAELATSLDPRDPAEFLTYWDGVWTRISIEALMLFWGPAVAVELLPDPESTTSAAAYSLLCDVGGYDLGECPSPDDLDFWRTRFASVGA